MTSPLKLAHCVLKTYDVERMRNWYCLALDARVVSEQLPHASFITYDEEHHRLAFALIPGEPSERVWKGPGLVHIAFTFADIRGLLNQYERLREAGSLPAFAINHGPTVSFYYNDPDGNAIELQIDRLNLEDGIKFMESPVFQKNNLGIPIDPEHLLKRMRAGASDEELLHYDASIPVDVPALGMKLMQVVHMV